MTEPTPPTTPSTSMSFTGPSGRNVVSREPRASMAPSIHPIGYSPIVNVAQNMA